MHAYGFILPHDDLPLKKKTQLPRMEEFLSQWATHGTPLKTGFALPYDHFIVIGLDEAVQGAFGLFYRCICASYPGFGKAVRPHLIR